MQVSHANDNKQVNEILQAKEDSQPMSSPPRQSRHHQVATCKLATKLAKYLNINSKLRPRLSLIFNLASIAIRMPRAIPHSRAEGYIVFQKSSQGDLSTFYSIKTTTSHSVSVWCTYTRMHVGRLYAMWVTLSRIKLLCYWTRIFFVK